MSFRLLRFSVLRCLELHPRIVNYIALLQRQTFQQSLILSMVSLSSSLYSKHHVYLLVAVVVFLVTLPVSGKIIYHDQYVTEIELFQYDFDNGSFIISQPGTYVLQEDITFCPKPPTEKCKRTNTMVNVADAFQPVLPSDKYDMNAFALGYFAAIVVIADDVVIDLNGYSMQLCDGFMLMQRFFSMIELSLHPFPEGAGPHDFVGPNNPFQTSSNVTIQGPGTLRRSSHHCTLPKSNIGHDIRHFFHDSFYGCCFF